MNEHNLGTVFGPTLFGDGASTPAQSTSQLTSVAGFGSGNDVVEQLLLCWPYMLL